MSSSLTFSSSIRQTRKRKHYHQCPTARSLVIGRGHVQDENHNMEVLILSTNDRDSLHSRREESASTRSSQSDAFVSTSGSCSSGEASSLSLSSSMVMDSLLPEITFAPQAKGTPSNVHDKSWGRRQELTSRRETINELQRELSSTAGRHGLVKGLMVVSDADGVDSWDDSAWYLPKKRPHSETTEREPSSVESPYGRTKVTVLEVVHSQHTVYRQDHESLSALEVNKRVSIPQYDSAQWHVWHRLRQRSLHHKNRPRSIMPLSSPHILYRWLRVRLAAGLIRSSLSFLHQTLEKKYEEAKILLTGLKSDSDNPEKYLIPLMELRDQLADVWCAYAHFILDVGGVAVVNGASKAKPPTKKSTNAHRKASNSVHVTNKCNEVESVRNRSSFDRNNDAIEIGTSVDRPISVIGNVRKDDCVTLNNTVVILESEKDDCMQPASRATVSQSFSVTIPKEEKSRGRLISVDAKLPDDSGVDRNDIVVILESGDVEEYIDVIKSPPMLTGDSKSNGDVIDLTTDETTIPASAFGSNPPDDFSAQEDSTDTGSFMVLMEKNVQDLLIHLGIRTPQEFLQRSNKSLQEDFVRVRAKQGLPQFKDKRSAGTIISRSRKKVRDFLEAKDSVKVQCKQSQRPSKSLRQTKGAHDASMQALNLPTIPKQFVCMEKNRKEPLSGVFAFRDIADHAISILLAACDCPLVGNHTLIALNLGRLIVSSVAVEKANFPPTPIELSRNEIVSKIKVAIATCWDAMSRCDGDSDFDDRYIRTQTTTQRAMELLSDFDFRGRKLGKEKRISKDGLQFGMQSVLDLPKALRDATRYDHMVFNDRNTIRSLCAELNNWSRVAESLESNSDSKLTLRRPRENSSSILTDELPMFRPLECFLERPNRAASERDSDASTISWEWE